MYKKLPQEFYLNPNVLELAKSLLGKVLCTNINGVLTSGIITETEAYNGEVDKASHTYGGRRTARTETMYCTGGVAYVYLCYGIHHLFNVVSNVAGNSEAVLIRAIKPLDGLETQQKRRNLKKLDKNSFIGPGKVSKALGIDKTMDGESLLESTIWIEDRDYKPLSEKIITGPRVGIDYAEEDALLPYRFQYFGF